MTIITVVTVVLWFLGMSGCGYSTGSLLRRDIHSVYVGVFDNTTWRRELEVDLTRQLTEELRLRTPLDIKSREEADSTLQGTLVGFDQEAVTQTEDDDILMRRITVKVKFRWIDNLTGQDLVPPQTFTERNTFAIARNEPLADRIFRETAETIVERMERRW